MKNLIEKTFIAGLLLSCVMTARAECYREDNSGEVVGTLLGAALGGLVGSQIGSGTGNKVAIGAGVLAGGLIGNNIGKKMDCKDRDYHYDTTQSALEYKQTGTAAAWRNPDSGNSGAVTPTKTYMAADGRPCREFTQTVSVQGQMEEIRATACREADGTWQIIDS